MSTVSPTERWSFLKVTKGHERYILHFLLIQLYFIASFIAIFACYFFICFSMQLWLYTYFPSITPISRLTIALAVPHCLYYNGKLYPRIRLVCNFTACRCFFDTVTANMIIIFTTLYFLFTVF